MGKITILTAILMVFVGASACARPMSEVRQVTVVVPKTVIVKETIIVPQTVEVPVTVVVVASPVPSTTKPPVISDLQKMEAVLAVELRGIRVLPEDSSAGRYSPEVRFTLWYKNKGTVGIRAFTGTAVFADLFDRPQKKLKLTYDEAIGPNAEVTDMDKMFEINKFIDADRWLATTQFENMHFIFEPMSIIFVDGTKLGSAN